MIQCARTKRRRKDSEEDSNETDTDLPEVDLYQLQVNTLRRYKRHFKVSTRPGLNKAQLADVSYQWDKLILRNAAIELFVKLNPTLRHTCIFFRGNYKWLYIHLF